MRIVLAGLVQCTLAYVRLVCSKATWYFEVRFFKFEHFHHIYLKIYRSPNEKFSISITKAIHLSETINITSILRNIYKIFFIFFSQTKKTFYSFFFYLSSSITEKKHKKYQQEAKNAQQRRRKMYTVI